MTQQEAIERLKNIWIRDALQEDYEALEMAIAALKAEPCEDAVRRETVRDMFCEIHCHNERSKCAFRNICKYMNHVSALPPVTPLPDKIDGMLEDAYEHGYQQARHDYEVQPCEDTISRKHLLSEIDELMQSPWFNNGKDFYDGTFTHYGYIERKEAVEIVRDLCVKTEPPVTPKPRWIPVDYDRYPETYPKAFQEVWITDGYGEVYHKAYDGTRNIKAWMPYIIPEPYKAESEGKNADSN